MPTSGSIDYSTSTRAIITEALELLGVLGEGEDYNQAQYESARRTLNSMVKMWQADGLNLFAVQRLYLFPTLGRPYYDITTIGQDLITDNYGQRFLDADSNEGSFQVTLDDATDASIGFYIGIASSATRMFWSRISNINNGVVTLEDPLEDDVFDGAPVYYFRDMADRPMRILEAYIHKASGAEIPLEQLSRVDYYSLSNKATMGQITQFYYDPQIGTGRIYFWPTGGSELDYIILLAQRTLSDFDSASDEPDYPQEWYMALAYGLAVALSPKFGTPKMDYERLVQLSDVYYETAKHWDVEQETSLFMKPNTWKMESSWK